MFCNSCLHVLLNKLSTQEIIILEYLNNNEANIPQCTIPREKIKKDLDMTAHKCYSSISKLEHLNMIERQIGTKSSRYYITENGWEILKILEKKLQEVN